MTTIAKTVESGQTFRVETDGAACLWPGNIPRCDAGVDERRIQSGRVIPASYYADQPYIVKAADGAWVCVITTGTGHEGMSGQNIVSMRSFDQGLTWTDRVDIEPPTGPEASWGVLLKAPSGRLYVFYVFNADDYRELPADNPPFAEGKTNRMDSHGHYVFRWSDDHGKSWSAQRVTIPVREFAIDRNNSTNGTVRLFWNVGRPVLLGSSVLLTLHKVKSFGAGWFTRSEGAFVLSRDLLACDDPAEASWVTLPEGQQGLTAPRGGGPIAEEQSVLKLSDGTLAVVYRSIDGYPVTAYSRDQGHSWSESQYVSYADGRRLKHPRAACFAWRLSHGGYVLWFHNHGGRFIGEHPQRLDISYNDRNPVWMCRGWEVETRHGLRLVWGNPEIVLYDDDPCVRMSYPDLVEEDGRMYLSETQKATARVHLVPGKIAQALRLGKDAFSAVDLRAEAVLTCSPQDFEEAALPELPHFLGLAKESPYGYVDRRQGISLELNLDVSVLDRDTTLFAAWHPAYGGVRVDWCEAGCLEIRLSDGRSEVIWSSDAGSLLNQPSNHVVIIVDGGPKIISFIVNGMLCDGGTQRQFGWGRFSPHFRGVIWKGPLEFTSEGRAAVKQVAIYPRALLATEAEVLCVDVME